VRSRAFTSKAAIVLGFRLLPGGLLRAVTCWGRWATTKAAARQKQANDGN